MCPISMIRLTRTRYSLYKMFNKCHPWSGILICHDLLERISLSSDSPCTYSILLGQIELASGRCASGQVGIRNRVLETRFLLKKSVSRPGDCRGPGFRRPGCVSRANMRNGCGNRYRPNKDRRCSTADHENKTQKADVYLNPILCDQLGGKRQ